jgi:spore coat polysaccharide biosynthesis protein SpsF
MIQARTGSSRLPRKVLLPLGGMTILQRMIERLRRARFTGKLIIITTKEAEDDIIEQLADNESVDCFRGSTDDLLDRHYQAALVYSADAVVKIPSDCPLIDPFVVDRVIYKYLRSSEYFDYFSNLHPQSYPDGNDVEVMAMDALEVAWKQASKLYEREHTTPYFWENPTRFRLGNLIWDRDIDLSMTYRWTLDYPEDYQLIKTVFNRLYPLNPVFCLEDILALLETEPELRRINEKYCGVNWYRHHLSELKTVTDIQTGLIRSE